MATATKRPPQAKSAATEQMRSINIELIVDTPHGEGIDPVTSKAASEATYRLVRDSISRYQAACRQMFAAYAVAQAAGARIEEHENGIRLSPTTSHSRVALATALGVAKIGPAVKGERGEGTSFTVSMGASDGYEMRDYFLQTLYPDALSFVWDSALRDVKTVWKAKDPKLNANRGWLLLQGARGVAEFQRRPIGFPRLTARPKLEGRSLTLKWDREIGAVKFNLLKKLQGDAYGVWRCLRDGEVGWEIGTVFLGIRDGILRATITYARPPVSSELQADRTLEVGFGDTPHGWLKIAVPGEEHAHTAVDADAALGALAEMAAKQARYAARVAANGSSYRSFGFRRGLRHDQKIRENLTQARTYLTKSYNHTFARRIADAAVRWRCGRVVIAARPEKLFGHDWPWLQLKEFITYKCQAVGAEVVFESQGAPVTAEESAAPSSP